MAMDRVALASASPAEQGGALPPPAFAHAPAAFVETRRRMSLNGWATLLVFLPPALLIFTIFVILPVGEAGWYSFFNWNGYGRPEKFIGLKNYVWLFTNPAFLRALVNNGLVIAVSLLIQLPLALGVALLVAGRVTGAVWFRMIFFLPYVLADVVAGLIWRFMLDGAVRHSGVLHWLLRAAERLLAGKQGLGLRRRSDRSPVEIFRLLHDALCRRPSGH